MPSNATKKPRRKAVNRIKVMYAHVEINGVVVTNEMNYERIEYDDGSVKETGLPKGMASKPSVGELLKAAISR